MKKIQTTAAVIAASVLLLAGCTQSESGTRHALYDSVTGIAGDSTLVAVVEIGSQRSDGGYTQSKAKVIDSYKPTGLAATLSEDERVMGAKWNPRHTDITVRQLGTSTMSSVAGSILSKRKRYLLFLGPTMVEGDSANDFYVTGGSVGIYSVEANGKTFVHGPFNEGDTLPETLSAAQLSS